MEMEKIRHFKLFLHPVSLSSLTLKKTQRVEENMQKFLRYTGKALFPKQSGEHRVLVV